MPFGLINIGATLQRAMNITYIGDQDNFLVIYLDYITVFSNSDVEHIDNLRRTFNKFCRYGLSLNPQKSMVALEEGKLLGHIVTKEGVNIYLKQVEVIKKISLPRKKKEVQLFLGRINFFKRFIPNYVEIV